MRVPTPTACRAAWLAGSSSIAERWARGGGRCAGHGAGAGDVRDLGERAAARGRATGGRAARPSAARAAAGGPAPPRPAGRGARPAARSRRRPRRRPPRSPERPPGCRRRATRRRSPTRRPARTWNASARAIVVPRSSGDQRARAGSARRMAVRTLREPQSRPEHRAGPRRIRARRRAGRPGAPPARTPAVAADPAASRATPTMRSSRTAGTSRFMPLGSAAARRDRIPHGAWGGPISAARERDREPAAGVLVPLDQLETGDRRTSPPPRRA